MNSRSGVATLRTAIHLLLTYLFTSFLASHSASAMLNYTDKHGYRRYQTPPPVRYCPSVGQFEYTPFISGHYVQICANITSSTKPVVHNVSLQRRQRRTEPQTRVTRTNNSAKITRVVPEICSRTSRHTNTLITILRWGGGGRSNEQQLPTDD